MTPRRAFMQRASERISQASLQAQTYRQRTVIPFTPCTLTFKNVEYSVPLPPVRHPPNPPTPHPTLPHAPCLALARSVGSPALTSFPV